MPHKEDLIAVAAFQSWWTMEEELRCRLLCSTLTAVIILSAMGVLSEGEQSYAQGTID